MTSPRIAYRETAARGATGVRLVILLYEQLIQDLTRAAQAIEQNDIELRTNCINHAILVIGYLQSPLDFDRGGKVARDLDKFYNTLRQNLVQVQFFPSKKGIVQQITDLLALRDAWIEVERAEKSSLAPAAVAASASVPSSSSAESESEPKRMDWRG
jgi:flagellar protein FliS